MMIFLMLFLEFFKIGLLSVGGGLATLPYLRELAIRYPTWFTEIDLMDMIAISQSTPGAMGVNLATYAGFKTAGISGGIIAVLGIVVPAIIVITIIATILEKFKNSKTVNAAFYGIRPAVTALILSSCIGIMKTSLFLVDSKSTVGYSTNIPAVVVFTILFIGMIKFKKHPIVYIALAALSGIIMSF